MAGIVLIVLGLVLVKGVGGWILALTAAGTAAVREPMSEAYRLAVRFAATDEVVSWAPVDWARFRGGYQLANRAPNINELFLDASTQAVTMANAEPCRSDTRATWGNVATNPNRAQVQARGCSQRRIQRGFDRILGQRGARQPAGQGSVAELVQVSAQGGRGQRAPIAGQQRLQCRKVQQAIDGR